MSKRLNLPSTLNEKYLRQLNLFVSPCKKSSFLEHALLSLTNQFQQLGHVLQKRPNKNSDLVFTSAFFGEVIPWNKALLFSPYLKFKIGRTPDIVTLLHAHPNEFHKVFNQLEKSLQKMRPDPEDFNFPGLAPNAYKVLIEQGRRYGPILAMARLLQGQIKSFRIILIVGDQKPQFAYSFDAVGSCPLIHHEKLGSQEFYQDIALRLASAVSTKVVSSHCQYKRKLTKKQWEFLSSPRELCFAGKELQKRNFFTNMIKVSDLVKVPKMTKAVSKQYSEGCIATWDPQLKALIATPKGSEYAVSKGNIHKDLFSIIIKPRHDSLGVYYQTVKGQKKVVPSSEAFEMVQLFESFQKQYQDGQKSFSPIRSFLHGHRGVAKFDPKKVEYVALEDHFFSFPVSCASGAQANAVYRAFQKLECFKRKDDGRKVAFTLLPCHGVIFIEKWVEQKGPLQLMWEYIDKGYLQIDSYVPQGPARYFSNNKGFQEIHLEYDPTFPNKVFLKAQA